MTDRERHRRDYVANYRRTCKLETFWKSDHDLEVECYGSAEVDWGPDYVVGREVQMKTMLRRELNRLVDGAFIILIVTAGLTVLFLAAVFLARFGAWMARR